MKSPNKYFMIALILLITTYESFSGWTSIGHSNFTGYSSYCDNDNYYVGYNYIGIWRYEIKENDWFDISYNLVSKNINSITGFQDKIYISNEADVYILDTVNKNWSKITSGELLSNTQRISKLVATKNCLIASALSNSGENKLFKYEDNIWTSLSITNNLIDINDINPMSVSLIDSQLIVSQKNNSGIAVSTDEGDTWSILTYKPDGINPTMAPEIVKIKNGNYYAYSLSAGFICSLDSGKTWQTNLGPNTSLNYNINNIEFSMNQIFIISQEGVHYSDLKLSAWYYNINGLFDLDLQTIAFNNKYAFVTSLSNVYQIGLDDMETVLTETPQLIYPPDSSYIEMTDIYFNWRYCNGAVGYHLQVARDSNFIDLVINNDSLLEDDFYYESLDNTDYYYWKVASISADHTVQWSDIRNFGIISNETFPNLIYPPDGAVDVDTAITFRWSKTRFAKSYDLSVSTESEFLSSVNYRDIKDTSFRVDGLSRNIVYYWRVNPYQISEIQDMSSIYMFTTDDELSVNDYKNIVINTDNNSIIISNYQSYITPNIKLFNYLGAEVNCNIKSDISTIIVSPKILIRGIYYLQFNNKVYPISL